MFACAFFTGLACYRGEELVRGGDITSSRVPKDIPAFNRPPGEVLFE